MKLSIYLVEQGYYPTRSQAHNAIKERKVTVNGRIVNKDGYEVNESDLITVAMEDDMYVSRGGYKLREALNAFKIDLTDLTVLDIGASTGGFTDCALQHGARKVYAYDVGHDQLAEKLRNDPRIISREGVNGRDLHREDFPEKIDFICMDVSFISCSKLLANIADILHEGGQAVILFKPQFEVGPNNLNNKGVVRNNALATAKMKETREMARILKLKHKRTVRSPITGQNGNQEYLMYFIKEGE